MVKRKTQPLIDSDSSSDSGSDSDLDSELLSLAKKKKTSRLPSNSPGRSSDSDSEDDSEPEAAAQRKKRNAKPTSSSESEQEDDKADSEPDEEEENGKKPSTVRNAQKQKRNDDEEEEKSELEEGQLTSDDESGSGSGDDSDDESGSSSSSGDSEFDDGYDDNLMGDEADRARLNALSEKERETEIFKRIERRDVMKTRWEIERKLKLAKKAERAKDKESQPPKKKRKKDPKKKLAQQKAQEERKKKAKLPSPEPEEVASAPPQQPVQKADSEPEAGEESPISSPDKSKESEYASGASDYFDPKERSKERKKNVEANRTDDKRSNAMAMLKAKREGKAKREEEEAKREAQRKAETEDKDELDDVPGGKSSQKLKASDIYSDDSGSSSDEGKKTGTAAPAGQRSRSGSSSSASDSRSSSDSETEGGEAKGDKKSTSSSSSSSKKPVAISTRDELNKLRISRHKIERFINLPMFDQVVLNCFVRINIGNNNGRPIYRVAEIVGVVETAKIYQLGKGRTNKGFRLKHGSQERVFRLEFISNQDFTDSEYQKWLSVCEATGTALPNIDMIDKKQREIKDAVTYEFKDADIDKIIEEKNRFRPHPTNYAMKKTLLMKERDAAQLRGEDELARDLNIQIQELEERASSLDKRRSSSISLISYINDRNRKRNVEDAEKAIMEEVRATRGVKIEDPFTRRQTQPRMSFKASEKRDEMPTMQMPAPPPPGQKKKVDDKKASSSSDNNLYSLHDFEIDLDVPLPIGSVNVLPKPVEKTVKETGPKRSLNLEDYKKKRGLI